MGSHWEALSPYSRSHFSIIPNIHPAVLSMLILRNFLEISSENFLERSCCFNASLMVLAELTRSRFSLGVEIRLLILAITRKCSEPTLAPRKMRTSKSFDACLASTAMWSIWFLVLWSCEIQVALWIFRCGKCVLLITNPQLMQILQSTYSASYCLLIILKYY